MRTVKKSLVTAVALIAALAFSPVNALAYSVNDDHSIIGYGQIWAVLQEDAKNSAVGADGDDGVDSAFGFKAKRLRLGFKGKMVDGLVGYKILHDFADGKLKDYYMSLNPGTVSINIGQFKPFVTYEGGIGSGAKLRNIDRASIVNHVNAAMFVNNNSFRDLGAQVTVKDLGPVNLLISATNGSGAGSSRDVGGSVSGGQIFANGAGDALYVIGAIANLADGMVRLNASYSMNKHNNLVLASDKTAAADMDRTAYSAGLEVNLKDIGLWLDGEYLALKYGDKDLAGEAETSGYYVRAGFWAMPKALEIVARYENEDDKGINKGTKDESFSTKQLSIGLNYYIEKAMKIQLEYTNFDYEEGDDASSIRANFQVNI